MYDSRFGGADFSYADIEGRASFADVVFFPGAEAALPVSFIGTHFARGADFIGTRFLVPTRFRYMNLAPLRFSRSVVASSGSPALCSPASLAERKHDVRAEIRAKEIIGPVSYNVFFDVIDSGR